MLVNPCLNTSFAQSKQKWCDPALPIAARVTDMLARMSLAEKIVRQLRHHSGPFLTHFSAPPHSRTRSQLHLGPMLIGCWLVPWESDVVANGGLQASMRDASAPIPSLALPYYDWWNEATHGVASGEHGVRNTEETPYNTNFPFPITTGMSFNRSLWYKTGAQIGLEARAFMNEGNAFSTFWAPVINLAREPRVRTLTPRFHRSDPATPTPSR